MLRALLWVALAYAVMMVVVWWGIKNAPDEQGEQGAPEWEE